jgi:hypothetical protein
VEGHIAVEAENFGPAVVGADRVVQNCVVGEQLRERGFVDSIDRVNVLFRDGHEPPSSRIGRWRIPVCLFDLVCRTDRRVQVSLAPGILEVLHDLGGAG